MPHREGKQFESKKCKMVKNPRPQGGSTIGGAKEEDSGAKRWLWGMKE